MMLRRSLALAALVSAAPLPALAHHGMGGALPETFWQGLLSGFAHPVIGLDHLAFLIAAAVLLCGWPAAWSIAALTSFVAAGAVGTILHLAGIGLGPTEAVVALSATLVGLALWSRGTPIRPRVAVAGFAAAGLFHGHAYAEAIVGAEPTPILAYLLGLALVQLALGLGAWEGARRVAAKAADQGLRQRRAAGALAAAVGVVALLAAVTA